MKKNIDVRTKEGRADFYRSTEWLMLRQYILSKNPLCERCLKKDRITPATEIHHRVDLAYFPEGRLDPNNLEALCAPCHNSHSAREATGSELDLEVVNRNWKIDVEDFNKNPK